MQSNKANEIEKIVSRPAEFERRVKSWYTLAVNLLKTDKGCDFGEKKIEPRIVRSSAVEYLTFVASVRDQKDSVEVRYEDENIWFTQKMMAMLYDVSVPAINQHIKRIYDDSELEPEATIKRYLLVQQEGMRSVNRNVDHYGLQMIIAVGFKVNNDRAVQFRKCANTIVKSYTIKG